MSGPEEVISYRGPLRELSQRSIDRGQSVSDVATALVHLARFRRILEFRCEPSQDQPPFKAFFEPKGLRLGQSMSKAAKISDFILKATVEMSFISRYSS
ncbi:hypothetical protein QQS21_008518 [Conoideocrella luteorostrata]|uniref:Uncharacterized protein n=1 Tax=Conoideocrella luteorostrata TaxID=1105319 RepID=A0AAJ0FRC2_9HYPO|nr:hypothetical protein QQS21_008518 [Conoideocrella luteorostrata]